MDSHSVALEVIYNIAGFVYTSSLLSWIAAVIIRRRAVPGTRIRYIASSWAVGGAAGIAMSSPVLGVIYLMRGEYFMAGLDAFLTVYWTWQVYREFNNEDNWFNDQWKKFKRGMKKLRQKLSALKPSSLPSPLPSPA